MAGKIDNSDTTSMTGTDTISEKPFTGIKEIFNPLVKNTQGMKDPDALEAGVSFGTFVLGYFIEYKLKPLSRIFDGLRNKVTVGGN